MFTLNELEFASQRLPVIAEPIDVSQTAANITNVAKVMMGIPTDVTGIETQPDNL